MYTQIRNALQEIFNICSLKNANETSMEYIHIILLAKYTCGPTILTHIDKYKPSL